MFDFLFKTTKRYTKQVEEINKFYEKYKNFTSEEILNESEKLKEFAKEVKAEKLEEISKKKKKNDNTKEEELLYKSFALTKVAAEKTIGLKAYDVQLYGGLVLNEGKIAEMKTGEGKTLVAVFPAYFNAIMNGSVLIVTVNDYLAKRDATQMGQVFAALGLTTGVIQHEMKVMERKEQYAKDIVYVTNKEFGFDYLKDNMAYRLEHCILPELSFILVDEVDSVLIDEARTPLIISNPTNVNLEHFEKCTEFIRTCKVGEIIDKDEGLSKLTKLALGEGLEETGDIVVDGENKKVMLTEEGVKKAEQFFGCENWSSIDTLSLRSVMQQCLVAHYILKENIDYLITSKNGHKEVKIIDDFSGRIAEGKEYSHGLHQAVQAKHNLEISQQSMAVAQITYPNLFKVAKKLAGMTGTALTEKEEFMSLYGLEIEVVPTNKPVIRIDQNDKFYFTREDKYKAILANIKEAMAIERPILIGTPNIRENEKIAALLQKEGIKHEVLNAKYEEREAEIIAKAGQRGAITVATNMAGRGTDILIDDYTRSVGGLLIIGVERHESRRIDNQLCGRAGRQGDPGESRFFVSLEDDILEFFPMPSVINKLKNDISEGTEVSLPIMSSIIDKAQAKICGNNYRIRVSLMQDDNVINQQRKILYDDRNAILHNDDIISLLKNYTYSLLEENKISDEDKDKLINKFEKFSQLPYENKEDIIKEAILVKIDNEWANYLTEIENIQADIVFASISGGSTAQDFIFKSYEAFDIMIDNIKHEIVASINELTEEDFKPKEVIAFASLEELKEKLTPEQFEEIKNKIETESKK